MTRSQTRKFEDKLNGLELVIKRSLIMEEDLKPNKDIFSESYIYLEAQIKVQDEMELGSNLPQNGEKRLQHFLINF